MWIPNYLYGLFVCLGVATAEYAPHVDLTFGFTACTAYFPEPNPDDYLNHDLNAGMAEIVRNGKVGWGLGYSGKQKDG